MVSPTDLNDRWKAQKEKLKQQFAVLTDKDLEFEPGKKDEMLTKLQVILGKTKGDLHKILEAL
jgi:uncharacterized protein YjbJ (UPF0337 family)